jgi:hypothetical protein
MGQFVLFSGSATICPGYHGLLLGAADFQFSLGQTKESQRSDVGFAGCSFLSFVVDRDLFFCREKPQLGRMNSHVTSAAVFAL